MSAGETTRERTGRRGRVDKREAILDAALRVFSREGYERASIDMIAAEAGVAKPTIYNHLGGKENLFRQIMVDAARETSAKFMAALDGFPTDPAGAAELRERLLTVAPAMVECFHHPESWALQRLLYAESVRFPDLYGDVRANGAGQVADALAGRLARLGNAGHLRIADPDRAAAHFIALLTHELVGLSELGNREVPPAEVERVVTAGVDAFLRAYAPA
ncbi:TetR/AcrR family transcriptional regulator [Actinomadura montaniterrae]|uniref:TetR/AcrR family transcriptional regulator n=1 Tax=Actinomadura montaniterrae TaxID=1803903 RepID=A0A6L3VIX6_9ACTN|nr:TetR/AcrR family transcriptional regulator [Actinomadura montaniterrae]KAB2370585.1 TetR/AcrR family transcriptional regulator [Actinomadura montaniterrae]